MRDRLDANEIMIRALARIPSAIAFFGVPAEPGSRGTRNCCSLRSEIAAEIWLGCCFSFCNTFDDLPITCLAGEQLTTFPEEIAG